MISPVAARLLSVGILLAGAFLARRLALLFSRQQATQRAFLLFVLFLGASALAIAAADPRWGPAALGIQANPLWAAGCFLSVVITVGVVYPLSQVLFMSHAKWTRPTGPLPEIRWFAAALFVGVVEEYYFRGVWGALCREPFGSLLGAVMANGVYVAVLLPWIRTTRLRTLGALYGFGLALSWSYEVTHSLAVPAGIHTAAYYINNRLPRSQAGPSQNRLPRWIGEGLGPVALYWAAASICVRWIP